MPRFFSCPHADPIWLRSSWHSRRSWRSRSRRPRSAAACSASASRSRACDCSKGAVHGSSLASNRQLAAKPFSFFAQSKAPELAELQLVLEKPGRQHPAAKAVSFPPPTNTNLHGPQLLLSSRFAMLQVLRLRLQLLHRLRQLAGTRLCRLREGRGISRADSFLF